MTDSEGTREGGKQSYAELPVVALLLRLGLLHVDVHQHLRDALRTALDQAGPPALARRLREHDEQLRRLRPLQHILIDQSLSSGTSRIETHHRADELEQAPDALQRDRLAPAVHHCNL